MVAIDSDVLMLAYAFHRDSRQQANQIFLEQTQSMTTCVAIYSIMEVLGQLCFNLSPHQLAEWPSWLQDRHNLTVLYPQTDNHTSSDFFQTEFVNQPFSLMQKQRIPYLDGLILGLIERTPGIRVFVSWNARHFQNKTPLLVLTPTEYLAL